MALINLTWTPPTVDTSGSPVTLSQIRVYKDNALIANLPPTSADHQVDMNPGESADFHVTAVGPGGESDPSNVQSVAVASGIPAPITDLAATEA